MGTMILFFNWNSLVKESNNDPLKIVDLLKKFKANKILKHGLRNKLKGNSFLINAEKILEDNQTDILYIYQYIFLAAKRDYNLYKLYGVTSLPLSYYPDIELGSIRHNPLLDVTNNEIKFKYEE